MALKIRLFRIMLIVGVAFGVVEARLAWVQLGGFGWSSEGPGSWSQQAFLQSSDQLVLDTGRGQFVDRQGKALTGRTLLTLAAYPSGGMPRGPLAQVEKLATILGTGRSELQDWLAGVKEPLVWHKGGAVRPFELSAEQAEAVRSLGLSGVYVLPYMERYPIKEAGTTTAIHAIGFVSQYPERLQQLYEKELTSRIIKNTALTGASGLELSMDRLIRGIGETKAVAMTDAVRRPLEGLGVRIFAPDNPHYPLKVVTTLDANIQEATERVLARHGVKQGAAVVLDAANADILAMVSRPDYDPMAIGSKGTDVRNHALIAVPPGSIFKTVTLAAALEAGVTTLNERFRCTGHYGRYGLSCWLSEGHGVITVEQAYAESCNVVFAALAERLDPRMLQETADRMGLGRQVGWHAESFMAGKPLRLLEEEDSGRIFASVQGGEDGGVRAGTGIGQRDVRITPLQAANLAVTILHGGEVLAPRLVREIHYADGGVLQRLPSQPSPSGSGRIRPETAAALRKAMRAVVTDGTGSKALGQSVWPLAGKSGTAQIKDGSHALNDHWFIGYGPAKGKPRYAVCVLIENQKAEASNRASALFGEIMDELRRNEQPVR